MKVILTQDSPLGSKGDVVSLKASQALKAIADGLARGAVLAEIAKRQQVNEGRIVRKGA